MLLLTLLMPGLLYSRQAAARAQCLNNLKQLGIALHNYEARMNVLPPGCVNSHGPIRNEPVGYHMSWIAQTTALVDQVTLFESLDWTHGAYAPTTTGAAGLPLSTLRCPSDPEVSATSVSSYAGCIGGSSMKIDVDATGLLYLNSSIASKDISDGQANTFLAGEVHRSSALINSGLGWASGTAATLRSSGVALNATENADYEVVTDEAGGFGSWHESVVPFLFADGAVKSMSTKTDLEILIHLGDRADGKMLEHSDAATRRRVRNRQQLDAIRSPEASP